MNRTGLSNYLNHHLAASNVALELLDHLIDSGGEDSHPDFVTLKQEVQADRLTLQKIMASVEITTELGDQLASWWGAKVVDIKRLFDHAGNGFEAVEALVLGLRGKNALWELLLAVADQAAELEGFDYGRLIERGQQQLSMAERHRVRLGLLYLN